jgi:hypothetical protein
MYRLYQIKPRDGDSFLGEGTSTVLSGAAVLGPFEKFGGTRYRARFAAPGEALHGNCATNAPLCDHTADCFLDSKPLHRVGDITNVRPGTCLLDTARNVVFLGDDPAGRVLEVSTAQAAFSGPAVDVTISGLTVEKYASPAQMGAIGGQYPGRHWNISNCTVRWNHGAGILVSDSSAVSDNRVIQNGQLGIAGHGANILIQNNEIASNNYAGFDIGWEAGGAKFSHTGNLTVKGNHVHDNSGPGLWTDMENDNVTYEANKVVNNSGEGIKHEISFAARIHGNFVSGNGKAQSIWLWGSQILIQNSSGADVSQNTVVVPRDYGNGIGVILQNRGKYVARDNVVHDNDITHLDPARGYSGIACDYDLEAALIPTNHFNGNHYHVSSPRGSHWFWRTAVTWGDFRREYGAETQGTVDTSVRWAR